MMPMLLQRYALKGTNTYPLFNSRPTGWRVCQMRAKLRVLRRNFEDHGTCVVSRGLSGPFNWSPIMPIDISLSHGRRCTFSKSGRYALNSTIMYTEWNLTLENDSLELIIDITVNWHRSKGILTTIACYPCQTHLEKVSIQEESNE